jgi:hypothetical protein
MELCFVCFIAKVMGTWLNVVVSGGYVENICHSRGMLTLGFIVRHWFYEIACVNRQDCVKEGGRCKGLEENRRNVPISVKHNIY